MVIFIPCKANAKLQNFLEITKHFPINFTPPTHEKCNSQNRRSVSACPALRISLSQFCISLSQFCISLSRSPCQPASQPLSAIKRNPDFISFYFFFFERESFLLFFTYPLFSYIGGMGGNFLFFLSFSLFLIHFCAIFSLIKTRGKEERFLNTKVLRT